MSQPQEENIWNRRNMIKLGFTAIAGTVTSGFIIKNKTDDCIPTPIQEVGPYPVMKFRKQADHDIDLTKINGHTQTATGEAIIITGRVQDEHCKLVSGAVVEIWQANNFGKYRHELSDEGESDPNFQGWGQAVTNAKGEYRFKTILPGQYNNRARHIHFKIACRGYHELVTQMYFEGDPRLAKDPLLNQLTHEEQMPLILSPGKEGEMKKFSFDIHLEKLLPGKVSEKVLKEYTGTYTIQESSFDLKNFFKTTTGNDYEVSQFKLYNKGLQLYISFPFFIPVETGWTAKDEFQSWSFFNSFFRFQRDTAGKVIGLHLHINEDQFAVYKLTSKI